MEPELSAEALDVLGRALLEEMERLDPSYPDIVRWVGLNEIERDFYRYSALAVLEKALSAKIVR